MEKNQIVIQIPETEELAKANLTKADLEKMITKMFDGLPNYGYTSVLVKGGPQTEPENHGAIKPDWEVGGSWTRACSK